MDDCVSNLRRSSHSDDSGGDQQSGDTAATDDAFTGEDDDDAAPQTPATPGAATSLSSALAKRNIQRILARGTGPEVPIFLRHDGFVRRVDLSKRQTELILKELWSLKSIADEERRAAGEATQTLPEFFTEYLAQRFPERERFMEFSYNFVIALRRYAADADVELFAKVLFGDLSEEIYYDQVNTTEISSC